MDFTVKTEGEEVVNSVPGLIDCWLSYFHLSCCCFLPLGYIVFYGVDYISHLVGVTITTYLCYLLFIYVFFLNLLASLVLSTVLLATLHHCE